MVQGAKSSPHKLVKFRVCLTEQEAIEMAVEAEKVGCRAKGLKVVLQKEHGFANEKRYNTQGLAKFLIKHCYPTWKDGAIEREIKRREVIEKAKALGMEVK